MSSDAHHLLERVKRLKPPPSIDRLLAILSSGTDDRLLLVYDRDPVPADMGDWVCCHWRQLGQDHSRTFAGPVLGLSGLGALLPEVPTHGTGFHSLEPLFDQDREALHRSYAGLARALLTRRRDIHDIDEAENACAESEAARLLVRLHLVDRPAPFGVILSDLDAALDGIPESAVLSDLDALDTEWVPRARAAIAAGGWIAALDELRLLSPELQWPEGRWVDLRTLLRPSAPGREDSGLLGGSDWTALLNRLARALWGLWDAIGDPALHDAAYRLALEARLLTEDPEDLVAILPADDLGRFIATGEAIRVYRGARPLLPDAESPPGRILGLDTLTRAASLDTACFGPSWFSFTALAPWLTGLNGQRVGRLGPVLVAAGRTDALARTSWLLARDLLDSSGLRDTLGIPDDRMTEVIDLALRAMAWYDLDDPWQWRQDRRDLLRAACRGLLHAALERAHDDALAQGTAADRALAEYWCALGYWYCTGEGDLDLTGDLARMPGALRTYRERADPQDPRRESATALASIGDLVWGSGREPGDWRAPTESAATCRAVDRYLDAVADDSLALETPSPLLAWRLREYAERHARVEALEQARGARPAEESIRKLLEWLHRRLRVVQLPEHESTLMRHLYASDIARLEGLRDAMGTGALIDIRVLNPWLDQGVEDRVWIEIENQGTETARDLALDLVWRDGSAAPVREYLDLPTTLPPGRLRPRIEFPVQAQGPALVLEAVYRFADSRGEIRNRTPTLTLEVRPPPRREWNQLKQPYEAGNAVFGPGRFFGRETELGQIASVLAGGISQPILVRGPRRMGKSSLLKQVEWLLQNPDALHRFPSTADHADALRTISPVYYSLQILSATGPAAIVQFFNGLLEKIGEALGVSETPSLPPRAWDPVLAFQRVLGRLLDTSSRRLLIMVDEWDEVVRPGLETLGINLRSVMLEEQRVNWIVSSTWITRHARQEPSSPLHNMSKIIEIKEPDWESARAIVTEPSRRIGVHWLGHAVLAVVTQTGQWPFLIQMLGARIVELLADKNKKPPPIVEAETVREVIGQVVRGDLPTAQEQFKSIFAQAAPAGDDRDAVRALGWLILRVLDQTYPTPLHPDEIRRRILERLPIESADRPGWAYWFDGEFLDQIELLHEVQYVIARDEERCYQMRVPIFRDWFHFTAAGMDREKTDRLIHDFNRTQQGANP